VDQDFMNDKRTCGNGLAREGGMSVADDVECAGPIAGKPAPTGSGVDQDFLNDKKNCGSGLAREGVAGSAVAASLFLV
jgi:hypothetical protein